MATSFTTLGFYVLSASGQPLRRTGCVAEAPLADLDCSCELILPCAVRFGPIITASVRRLPHLAQRKHRFRRRGRSPPRLHVQRIHQQMASILRQPGARVFRPLLTPAPWSFCGNSARASALVRQSARSR
jgi:hypothetical protein